MKRYNTPKPLNELDSSSYEKLRNACMEGYAAFKAFVTVAWVRGGKAYKFSSYGTCPYSGPETAIPSMMKKHPDYFKRDVLDDFTKFFKEAASEDVYVGICMDKYDYRPIHDIKKVFKHIIDKLKQRPGVDTLFKLWQEIGKVNNRFLYTIYKCGASIEDCGHSDKSENRGRGADERRICGDVQKEYYDNPDKWLPENNHALYKRIMRNVGNTVKSALDEGYVDDSIWKDYKPIKSALSDPKVPQEVIDQIEDLLARAHAENMAMIDFTDELELILKDY